MEFGPGVCNEVIIAPTARARSMIRQAKLKAKRELAQYCEASETACSLGRGTAYEVSS